MDPTPATRTRNTVKFLTAAGIGTTFLVTAALILTATVISLVLATPVLVIFSPLLVPAAIVAALATSGFVVSGGLGVAALSALGWIYNYVSGKHPVGSDKVDAARMKMAQAARAVTDKAKDYGHYVQIKASEVSS